MYPEGSSRLSSTVAKYQSLLSTAAQHLEARRRSIAEYSANCRARATLAAGPSSVGLAGGAGGDGRRCGRAGARVEATLRRRISSLAAFWHANVAALEVLCVPVAHARPALTRTAETEEEGNDEWEGSLKEDTGGGGGGGVSTVCLTPRTPAELC